MRYTHNDSDTLRETHPEREKRIERHTQRYKETGRLETHTLRETPSSGKGHTLLRARYTHTH